MWNKDFYSTANVAKSLFFLRTIIFGIAESSNIRNYYDEEYGQKDAGRVYN